MELSAQLHEHPIALLDAQLCSLQLTLQRRDALVRHLQLLAALLQLEASGGTSNMYEDEYIIIK